MENSGTLASFKAIFNNAPALAGSALEALSSLHEAKKERTDTLLLFVPLYVKADNFIKNMVVHQESLDDAKSVLSMVKETIKANSMAIQVSKFGDSKNKISGLNDRMIFIAEFYEFWIDTHEAIKSPETKYVSIDEL